MIAELKKAIEKIFKMDNIERAKVSVALKKNVGEIPDIDDINRLIGHDKEDPFLVNGILIPPLNDKSPLTLNFGNKRTTIVSSPIGSVKGITIGPIYRYPWKSGGGSVDLIITYDPQIKLFFVRRSGDSKEKFSRDTASWACIYGYDILDTKVNSTDDIVLRHDKLETIERGLFGGIFGMFKDKCKPVDILENNKTLASMFGLDKTSLCVGSYVKIKADPTYKITLGDKGVKKLTGIVEKVMDMNTPVTIAIDIIKTLITPTYIKPELIAGMIDIKSGGCTCGGNIQSGGCDYCKEQQYYEYKCQKYAYKCAQLLNAYKHNV